MMNQCECGGLKDSRSKNCRDCGYAKRHFHLWSKEEIVALLQAWAEEHGRTPTAKDWEQAQYGRPSGRTVDRHLGSWNAAIRAAGLPVNRAGGKEYWTRDLIAGAMLDFLFLHGRWPTLDEWNLPKKPGEPDRPSKDTVLRHFDKWTDAKRYAGWAPETEREGRTYSTWSCRGCGADDPASGTIGCPTCVERLIKRRKRGLRIVGEAPRRKLAAAPPLAGVESHGSTRTGGRAGGGKDLEEAA